MKAVLKFLLPLTLAFASTTAMANDQLKIATAKMAISNADVGSYATPSLQALLAKVERVQEREQEEGYYCDFAEQYYLGLGQDWHDGDVKLSNINVSVLPNGNVKIQQRGLRDETIIKMSCQSGACLIDDAVFGGESLRQDAQKIVQTGQCS